MLSHSQLNGDSTPALLITEGADTSLTWFDGSLRFDLQAPTSLAGKDANRVANLPRRWM